MNQQMLIEARKTKTIPHLLLHGGTSTGKTKFLHELIRELGFPPRIFVNSPLDSGLGNLRTIIYPFMRTGLHFRLVIFQAADYLTKDIQFALRRILEETEKYTRFVFIAENTLHLDPALLSRVLTLVFPTRYKFPIHKEFPTLSYSLSSHGLERSFRIRNKISYGFRNYENEMEFNRILRLIKNK